MACRAAALLVGGLLVAGCSSSSTSVESSGLVPVQQPGFELLLDRPRRTA